VTVQWGGKASAAMNNVLIGTATAPICVPVKAPVSIRVNSESGSNEIDESDWQHERHDKQRI
jgi:hypothetical protein